MRAGEAGLEDLGAEFESDGGDLFGVIPDDDLVLNQAFVPSHAEDMFTLTDLVCWELGGFPSSYEGDVVSFTQHLGCADTRVKICLKSISLQT